MDKKTEEQKIPTKTQKGFNRADHDGFFKRIFINPETRIDFLQNYFHEKEIDIKDLDIVKESDINSVYARSLNDIILTTKARDKYFYIMIEHQSSSDADIAFRLMKYKLSLLERFRIEYPEKKFPTIYQLVIYNGETEYDAETIFWDLFQDPKKAKEVFDRGYTLVDLQKMDNNCLKDGKLLEGFGKDIKPNNKDLYDNVVKIIIICYNKDKKFVFNAAKKAIFREIINYAMAKLPVKKKENLIIELKKHDEGFMQTIAQSFRQEGIQQGIQQGMQQGMQQGVQQGMHQKEIDIAKNMLAKNLNANLISEMTGLSLDVISQLK